MRLSPRHPSHDRAAQGDTAKKQSIQCNGSRRRRAANTARVDPVEPAVALGRSPSRILRDPFHMTVLDLRQRPSCFSFCCFSPAPPAQFSNSFLLLPSSLLLFFFSLSISSSFLPLPSLFSHTLSSQCCPPSVSLAPLLRAICAPPSWVPDTPLLGPRCLRVLRYCSLLFEKSCC